MGGLIRALMAMGLAILGTLIVRVLGGAPSEPEKGGWRPLSGPDLR